LSLETETELNMADPATLRGFIAFATREYSAERYALIIWGHGTGWRSFFIDGQTQTVHDKNRAVAIDDYNGTYMDLPALKSALGGIYFDMIGFDTCFGATLETAYELSNSAEYLVASPGIIASEGWSYDDIFSYFDPAMDADEFCEIIMHSFMWQYGQEDAYSISKISLSAVKPAAEAFCEFAQSCADVMTSAHRRNEILSILMNEIPRECAPVYPCDLFFDAPNIVVALNDYVQASDIDDDKKLFIQNAADNALANIDSCVLQTVWRGAAAPDSITVFFNVLESENVCAPSHDSAYVKDSGFINQSSFIKETEGWAPTRNSHGTFLDKVFYTAF
jgi:hypothetical protein